MQRSQVEGLTPFGPFTTPPELSKRLKLVTKAHESLTSYLQMFSDPEWVDKVLLHQSNIRRLFTSFYQAVEDQSPSASPMELELVYRDLRQAHSYLGHLIDQAGHVDGKTAYKILNEVFDALSSANNYGQVLVRRSFDLEREKVHQEPKNIILMDRKL